MASHNQETAQNNSYRENQLGHQHQHGKCIKWPTQAKLLNKLFISCMGVFNKKCPKKGTTKNREYAENNFISK